MEDSDVTDEQEQKLIADILKQNLSERQPIKSSPAALAENQHHRAGISPALLPSTPLYTRQSMRSSQGQGDREGVSAAAAAAAAAAVGGSIHSASNSQPMYTRQQPRGPIQGNSGPASVAGVGPLYTRQQVRVPEDKNAPGAPGPMYKPRHINPSWVRQQNGAAPPQHPGGPGPEMGGQGIDMSAPGRGASMPAHHMIGADMYVPRQTHSLPHMHSNMAASVRSSLGPDAKSSHSLPTFPTQPLMSQALPHVPGLGMPRQGQPLQPPMGTTFHTNLVIRPGMAYQPRFVRPQFPQPGQGHPGARHDAPWSPAQQGEGGMHSPGPVAPPQSMRGATPMWREHAPAPSQWAPGAQQVAPQRPAMAGQGMQLCVGIPSVMATGNRGQQSMVPTSGSHENHAEEEDSHDAQQVEHTTRLMLSHLCLE